MESSSRFTGVMRLRGALSQMLSATVAIALVMTACGTTEATDTEIPVGFPTIAPGDINGVYEIAEVRLGETDLEPVPFSITPTVELDVVTGSLDIATACNRHLGSFSAEADGRASFTITGGTSEPCTTELEAEDQLLLDILSTTSTWERANTENNTLAFTGEAGSMTWTQP